MAGLPTPDTVSANTATLQLFKTQFIDPLTNYMKSQNYSPDTTARYTKILITLAKRNADLFNTQSVLNIVALQNWNDGTKRTAMNALTLFLKYHKTKATTEIPKFSPRPHMTFLPTENEIDQLISGCKHRLATFLQTLKETGARYGEIASLTWLDLNVEEHMLNIPAEKHSNPRSVKVSSKLLSMLLMLPRNTKTLFDYKNRDVIRKNFQRARKRIAKNLGNPRLLQIHFHTLRHWKATTYLHQTGNVYLVMKLLGHKSLNNTQRYIQLLPEIDDHYTVEFAYTKEDDKKLLEAGYEYITERDGAKAYRKRK